MGWQRSNTSVEIIKTLTVFTLMMMCVCDGARRTSQRRQDKQLYVPSSSVESLQEIAEAMGAAGFEHYTEGKALVKRLIPANSQPDLDVVEYQGVIGRAGVDFPAYPNIPPTGFNCKNVLTGYYADLETDCQVFHICDTSRKISFLCPNGTIFSQSHLICDWWFKVDCASAPALYEASAEYYSNEQKKSQKITQSLSKNQDLQQIGTDTNIRAEPRRVSVNVPSTTERLLRSRYRQTEIPKATAKTFQTLFTDNFNPTQRTAATVAFEQRRNLVQLISNNFGNSPVRSTPATYADSPVYRSTAATPDLSVKEMQVAAETASFANNNNRQYLQDFHNKNYRPYPVYNPNVENKVKSKSNPTLTTLYDIRNKQVSQASQDVPRIETTTTKRPTLLPYTKSYTTIIEKQDPYTRPGVSLLKNYLHKEKNKTVTTTEKIAKVTSRQDRSDVTDQENKVTVETKDTFESATKIPHTTPAVIYTEPPSSDRLDIFSTPNLITERTTEASYQERRERLMRKLNLDKYTSTEATTPTTATDKYFENQPNKPGAPPSLTSKSLHSLAIYYATALDNLSTTTSPDETETVTPAFDEYETMDEALPALFSRQTINKYSNLFNHQSHNTELSEAIREDPNGTYNELTDLSVQQSQNPIATSPQIRELAQVFTHALSAYLQDPVQFRKVLSDIRPTHPSFGDLVTTTEDSINTEPTTTVNEEDDEILGFSDDNNELLSREPKSLGIPTTYGVTYASSTTTPPVTEAISAAYISTTTARSPFRCCGKISASYTSASPKLVSPTISAPIYSSTAAIKVNSLSSNYRETAPTDIDYSLPKYGGFQNNALTLNDKPYGTNRDSTEGKPLTEYVEVTNLPTAWGLDTSVSTVSGFESQKIRTTTIIPTTSVHFTETDSIELENDEELQRAHSQSFAAPQGNNIRHSKQLSFSTSKSENIKKPAEDLEAPTLPDEDIITVETTTQQPTTSTTTPRVTETETLTTTPALSETVFTSPDSARTTNQFAWSTGYDNWQSTVIDPITLNDGLSPTGLDQNQGLTENTYAPNTATTPTDFIATEQTVSSTVNYEVTSPSNNNVTVRLGRLLRDSSTETSQDLTTIADTVVEKAKEIMNVTTAEKLINVMKKTKSKTVKRLILLLIQTCDDDYNTTAEASKKALLEALMAVSQKDMDEMVKEEETTELPATEIDRSTVFRRFERPRGERRGKSLSFDASAVNSLYNSATTESIKSTQEDLEIIATTASPFRTSSVSRRGVRKFHTKPTTVEPSTTKVPFVDIPRAEARVSASTDSKTASDARALELLRSLYSIAARWG